mgnify:CR=1 FL=1
MAKSFLGAQLEEIPHLLDKIGPSLQKLAQVNAQVLSRKMGVMGPNGGGGGGGGTGLVGPSGQPLSPVGGGGPLPSGSIAEFLRRRNEGRSPTTSTGEGGGDSGSRTIAASAEELAASKTLGESVEYVRKLMRAAAWAGLSQALVLRSPKPERDALIAAYEESGTRSSATTQGSGNTVGPREVTSDNLGNYNTADANRGNTVVVGPYGGSPADHSSLAPLAHGAQSAKVGATPTAGDKLVAETVGGVTRAIEKLTAKIDNQGNLAFRTKGL